jgi:heat shock protein HslJ
MKKIKYLFIISLLVLALAACQSEDPTPEATAPAEETAPEEAAPEETAPEETAPEESGIAAQTLTQADIVDITWQWINFQDTAGVNDIAVPNPASYTIVFRPDGSVNINADCNVIQGTYTADSSSISIQQGPSTMAFCGEESLDQTYLAFLSQVATFVGDGSGNLVLNLMADAGNMVFANGGAAPIPTEPSGVLTDLVWQWTEFQDTAGINNIAVPNPANYSVIFRPDGALNIQADCNVVQGTYTDNNGSISIALGPSTMAFCGETSLDTQFLSLLNDAATYVFDGSGNLVLNLFADAGNMVFMNGGAAPPVTEIVPTGIFCNIIEPSNVLINTFGLPYSWQSNCVPLKPYDASQPPGPTGWPEHVQVNFGTLNHTERQPTDPVVFIMPSEGYRNLWANSGDPTVGDRLDRLTEIIAAESDDLPTDTPVLPVEEVFGPRDIFVQGKYLGFDGGAGVRFVARHAQDANPVTNENLRYIFQGFAGPNNEFFVAFFFPVATSYLPNTVADVTQEEFDRLNADVNAYLAERNEFLNSIPATEWAPSLELLDQVIDSLEYVGDLPPELFPPVELPPPDTNQAYGRVIAPVGVNVRTGPSANYTILGTAPFGAEGEIIGISPDGGWWVTPVDGAPNGQGWVSADYVEAFNTANVPVIQPPALPTPEPQPTATATPVPGPVINFWADRTSINQGECTHLRWDVQNVQAVWVYPLGTDYQSFPVTGNGARLECPTQTTTYEMRAQLTDGNLELRQVTINVNPGNVLANTNWNLDTLNNQSLLPNTSITTFFGNGGLVNGFSGCNQYSGSYTVSGVDSIAIRNISRSQALCADDVNNQENTYISLLQTAVRFELVGNQLILYDANGIAIMRFLRA